MHLPGARFCVQHPHLSVPALGHREPPVDFIFMLTSHDRTVADAEDVIEAACDLGVTHIGFKDVGVPTAVMQALVRRIRARGAVAYLEVVSTTPEAVLRSLEVARDLEIGRVLGGTDLDAAERILGDLSGYYPFPGRPLGHPTRLEGSAELVAGHCGAARARGCGGVDLLAYRATEADPLDLVRAARAALQGGRLIVAGSIGNNRQIDALGQAGVDAFTIGSAVFERTFSPANGSLRGQIEDILAACADVPARSA
jgi:thiamine monophosphate synthase